MKNLSIIVKFLNNLHKNPSISLYKAANPVPFLIKDKFFVFVEPQLFKLSGKKYQLRKEQKFFSLISYKIVL